MLPRAASNSSDADHARSAYWVLGLLALVYVFNFIDRQIIGILAIPIQAELQLTDTQLGLLGGPAFAVLYAIVSIPIARLADRSNRTIIVTTALAAWSLMTAACGVAQNYWQLFLARVGVGIGEGGGVAPAYSLIADYFPPNQRSRAMAAYSFGIPIGGAVGIVFGGVVATLLDWRTAFITIGLAGVALAPVVAFTIREPLRGRFDPPRISTRQVPFREVLNTLAKKPSFWLLAFGAATASTVGYGMFFWLPSFLVREFHLPVLQASLCYGGILLVGGMGGLWAGGWLADRLGRSNRRAYALVPGTAFLLAVPCFMAAISADDLRTCVLLLVIPNGLAVAWFGPVLAATQQLVPAEMRATTGASFMFINNLLGLGLGTFGIGALSDALASHYGTGSLRMAILWGITLYLLAATLYFVASRHLDRDWFEAAQ